MRGWAGRHCRPAAERRLARGSARANLDRDARCKLEALPRAERTGLDLVAVLGGAPTAEGRAARQSLRVHRLNEPPPFPPLRDRRSGGRDFRGPLDERPSVSISAETWRCTRSKCSTGCETHRPWRARHVFMYSAQRLSSPACGSGRSPLWQVACNEGLGRCIGKTLRQDDDFRHYIAVPIRFDLTRWCEANLVPEGKDRLIGTNNGRSHR
jgi:hypothetical protein